MIDIYLLITFLSSILNLFLGAIVFSRGIKKLSNIVFFLMAISTIAWVVSVYLSDYFKLPEKALLFVKLANISATWAIYLFLVFTFIFPKEFEGFFAQIKFYYIILPIIFSALFFNKFFITGIKIEEWGSTPILGELIVIHFGYLLGTILFGISNLVRKYIKSTGIEKDQLKFISFGLILTIISAILFNAVIPLITGSARSTKLAPATTIFFLFFTFLAITRYHLFGIEVILTEILVGVIGILLIVQIFTAPSTLWRIVNGGIFVLFCVFGYLLIRGVFREIKRKEEAERIALQERELRIRSERLKDEAERLAKAKDQFILSIQHHLRTPLTPVMGYLDMILEGSFGEEKNPLIKEKLIKTRKAVEVLHKLMEDLLEVSSMRIGKKVLDLKETQIENLIEEAKLELENQAKEKGLYLKFEKPKVPLPKMKLDEKRIREVIWNLIDNAIKYTERGGVVIDCKIQDSKCLIKIKDTGIGMTKEEIDYFSEGKLFERGEKAKKLWGPGRGIGLAISFEFVKAHGGKIWIESEGREKGTTFYVELPIK